MPDNFSLYAPNNILGRFLMRDFLYLGYGPRNIQEIVTRNNRSADFGRTTKSCSRRRDSELIVRHS